MNKCEVTECLMVDIHKHQSKPFTYIISNGMIMIGELVEDDIADFLSNKDLKNFYNTKESRFLVDRKKIRNIVKQPNTYYNGKKK